MKKNKKFASDNKIASNNVIKNSLINFDVDFNGLKDIISLFFPSIRHEIILRYRAETIAKIGIEAYKIAHNNDIQIIPIPPKIALPLIEKMSLEHEPDMFEKWAKLLIATGVNPNPKHQQYADILSNLDNHNASLLDKIYSNQTKPDAEKEYNEYIDKMRFQECYDAIKDHNFTDEESFPLHIYFNFPYYILGTTESKEPQNQYLFSSQDIYHEENTYFTFKKEETDMLIGLDKLGLIKYQVLNREYTPNKPNEDKRLIFREKCGILLTLFGYSFVDCLKHPTQGHR